MNDGRPELLHGVADVGTHHAFVNLLARVTWAMRDVPSYTLEVTETDAGVRVSLIAWLTPGLLVVVVDALRDAGMPVTYYPGVAIRLPV